MGRGGSVTRVTRQKVAAADAPAVSDPDSSINFFGFPECARFSPLLDSRTRFARGAPPSARPAYLYCTPSASHLSEKKNRRSSWLYILGSSKIFRLVIQQPRGMHPGKSRGTTDARREKERMRIKKKEEKRFFDSSGAAQAWEGKGVDSHVYFDNARIWSWLCVREKKRDR